MHTCVVQKCGGFYLFRIVSRYCCSLCVYKVHVCPFPPFPLEAGWVRLENRALLYLEFDWLARVAASLVLTTWRHSPHPHTRCSPGLGVGQQQRYGENATSLKIRDPFSGCHICERPDVFIGLPPWGSTTYVTASAVRTGAASIPLPANAIASPLFTVCYVCLLCFQTPTPTGSCCM